MQRRRTRSADLLVHDAVSSVTALARPRATYGIRQSQGVRAQTHSGNRVHPEEVTCGGMTCPPQAQAVATEELFFGRFPCGNGHAHRRSLGLRHGGDTGMSTLDFFWAN
jgi:hypothetical protein